MIAWRFELDGSRQNERRESLGRINFAFSRDVTGANERQTEQTRRQRGYQLPTGDLRNSASPLRLLTLLGVVGPFDVHKGRERGLSRGKTMRRPRSDLDSLRGPSDSPWSKQEIENDGCFTGRASAVVRPSSLCSSLTAKGNHWLYAEHGGKQDSFEARNIAFRGNDGGFRLVSMVAKDRNYENFWEG